MNDPRPLSSMIGAAESVLDQAITDKQPITAETVASLQETMIFWMEYAKQQELHAASLEAENANLKALLRMPNELGPEVFTGNVVPIGGFRS
ncbi:MAG: hypothetical protein AAF739_16945 [Pseudomonadota bacterium]